MRYFSGIWCWLLMVVLFISLKRYIYSYISGIWIIWMYGLSVSHKMCLLHFLLGGLHQRWIFAQLVTYIHSDQYVHIHSCYMINGYLLFTLLNACVCQFELRWMHALHKSQTRLQWINCNWTINSKMNAVMWMCEH